MDETKGTKGLSSETPGQASKGGEGNTSETEARTYTEEENRQAVSDALAKAGRDDKSLTKRENAVKAREDANKAEQERRDAAELVEAQKDPDKLAVWQFEQAERQRTKKQDERDAAQDKREADHESKIRAAEETQLEIEIWKIATKEGVDPVELKDTMKDLNLTTVEQAKSVAKRLNKKSEETTDKKKTHDSLVTSGGKESSEGKTSRQVFADYFRDEEKKK